MQMHDKEALTLLHLSLVNGIGPATIKLILDNKPEKALLEDLYTAQEKDIVHTFGLSASSATLLVNGLRQQDLLEKELELVHKKSIAWTTYQSDNYPEILRHIHAPPAVIYWRGVSLDQNKNCLAIVGSRKAQNYAKQVIDQIIPALVMHDWTIVSGGAIGADTMAHQAALDAQGKTIAVLGSGLLHLYPQQNRSLFEKILASGGTLLSIFPLNTVARPGNFPARNRIISGLSKGCLVVQAARESGACITASYALEQAREVFAVPGLIHDELSAGCHALIQEGAKLVTGAHDILLEFGYVIPKQETQIPLFQEQKQQESTIKTHEQKVMNNDAAYIFLENSPEAKIMKACIAPSSTDELIEKTALSLSELQAILFSMQLEGYIKQDFTGMWVTNI